MEPHQSSFYRRNGCHTDLSRVLRVRSLQLHVFRKAAAERYLKEDDYKVLGRFQALVCTLLFLSTAEFFNLFISLSLGISGLFKKDTELSLVKQAF